MAYNNNNNGQQFGDTTYTKVFLGGLAWETESDVIRSHFEKYGEIIEAVVISDKLTSRSKGYGFVTFRDPESARKACAEPNPVIDGRRANCNLASIGRPQAYFPYGNIRQSRPFFGIPQTPRGAYIGSPSFRQPGPSSYQPGFSYPSYGYLPYGPEFVYPQGVYNPYMGQQHLPMYGPSTNIGSYGQLGQPFCGTTIQGFVSPNLHLPQFTGLSTSSLSTNTTPTVQILYGTGKLSFLNVWQPRILIPGYPPQFTWNRSSDQTSG